MYIQTSLGKHVSLFTIYILYIHYSQIILYISALFLVLIHVFKNVIEHHINMELFSVYKI